MSKRTKLVSILSILLGLVAAVWLQTLGYLSDEILMTSSMELEFKIAWTLLAVAFAVFVICVVSTIYQNSRHKKTKL